MSSRTTPRPLHASQPGASASAVEAARRRLVGRGVRPPQRLDDAEERGGRGSPTATGRRRRPARARRRSRRGRRARMRSYATEVEIRGGASAGPSVSTASVDFPRARDAAQPGDDAERDRDVLAARGCSRSGARTTSSPVGSAADAAARRPASAPTDAPARSRAVSPTRPPCPTRRPPAALAGARPEDDELVRPRDQQRGSCSTRTSVLPASRSSTSASPSASTSRGWSPRDGSSRSTVMPVSSPPSSDASLTRCASPADSVATGRSRWT